MGGYRQPELGRTHHPGPRPVRTRTERDTGRHHAFMDNPDITSPRPSHPMTPNTLRARLSFSFKGDSYDLDSTIDLDHHPTEADAAPNFHLLLAKAAGIDPYSYLYEVLESHEIEFSEATGLAALCCRDGAFDWRDFERRRREEQDLRVVGAIAERMLGVGDLDDRADLKAALLAAYRAGREMNAV